MGFCDRPTIKKYLKAVFSLYECLECAVCCCCLLSVGSGCCYHYKFSNVVSHNQANQPKGLTGQPNGLTEAYAIKYYTSFDAIYFVLFLVDIIFVLVGAI